MWNYLFIFCAVYLGLILAGHALFRLLAAAKRPREKLLRRAYGANGFDPYQAAREDPWFDQIGTWERLTLDGGNGPALSAYVLRQEGGTHRWAVCLHDYGTDARYTAGHARWFFEAGYHILLPDARGCGHSSGTLLGLGLADKADLRRWIHRIVQEDPAAEVILFGLGSGGAESLLYCCDGPAEQVKGAVTDSSYAGLWEAILPHLMPRMGAMSKVVANFANMEYVLRCGMKNDWRKGDVWKRMGSCPVPVLLIHGEEDYFFTVKHFEVLAQELPGGSSTLRLPHTGHIAGAYIQPEPYWRAVEQYLDTVAL